MTSLKKKPHLIVLNGTALNWVTLNPLNTLLVSNECSGLGQNELVR